VSLLSRKHSYEKLADIPFFAGWTNDELAHVDRVAEWVDYQPLEHLIKQGTTGYEFIVILSGDVDVAIDGHVVANLGPGDHVGEIFVAFLKPLAISTDHCPSMSCFRSMRSGKFSPW